MQRNVITAFVLGLSLFSSSLSLAKTSQNLCVFDLSGANGEVMTIAKDYAVVAKKWGMDINLEVRTRLEQAIADFESKKCDGVIADNFSTKKYNNFMGTIGATGAIPNYSVAESVLKALSSPKLARKLANKNYEVVGYIPIGIIYFFVKDRNLNNLERLRGKRFAVLASDPTQARMAQRVGMRPIDMTYDDVAPRFRKGEFDMIPSPLMAYAPLELGKIMGSQGGIVNFPIAFLSMVAVWHTDSEIPKDFAQRSRNWFSARASNWTKKMQIESQKIPKQAFFDIPEIDKPSYEILMSQLRKEFVTTGEYDKVMITLIRYFRCKEEPNFVECKK